MVAGYHLFWTAYGWWLPNDPRGSSSSEIRVEQIAELGELHPGRKPVQPLPADLRRFYDNARSVLQHQLLTFNESAITCLAEAFGNLIAQRAYTCYACAIMPDHVHAVIRKHRDKAEAMIAHLQDASRCPLIEKHHRPAEHPVWGGPGWKVFLDTRQDMERVVKYINDNPIKAGRPAQEWPFVKQYDGWIPYQ